MLKHRIVCRVKIEAVTPIAVCDGTRNIMTDALVSRDVNGMPYIPGTSIAGVLRHAVSEGDKEEAEVLFGSQSFGSEVIISDAIMIGEDGKAVDGISAELLSPFYQRYKSLPIRQHVRIDHKGVASKAGKFDGEVVYKGTRFVFDIELMSKNRDNRLTTLLSKMCRSTFRLGSGTRNGLGAIKIVDVKHQQFDFSDIEQLKAYASRSSSLSQELNTEYENIKCDNNAAIKCYNLTLKPLDFFLFGAGLGDDEADVTPVHEDIVVWDDKEKPSFCAETVLIPATSLKGALAHRTAYYYNKIKGVKADSLSAEELNEYVGDKNEAVKALFGSSFGDITRGKVLFNDIIENCPADNKVLSHVAIDRFTNAPIDGALYQEKVTDVGDKEFVTSIVMTTEIENVEAEDAFKKALDDLCRGLLPLGGGVNRGHGRFIGSFTITQE